jgi:hypothetical protein
MSLDPLPYSPLYSPLLYTPLLCAVSPTKNSDPEGLEGGLLKSMVVNLQPLKTKKYAIF